MSVYLGFYYGEWGILTQTILVIPRIEALHSTIQVLLENELDLRTRVVKACTVKRRNASSYRVQTKTTSYGGILHHHHKSHMSLCMGLGFGVSDSGFGYVQRIAMLCFRLS